MNEAQTRLDKIASHGARHAVTFSCNGSHPKDGACMGES